MKSASRADRRAARFAAPLLVAAAAVCLEARAPQRASAALPPAWVACAGGAAGATAHPVRRLTALADKAVVEPDIVHVFAQREKEQRVSAANLAKARLSIDFLYAAGDGAARIYYYEASKTIPDAEGLLRVSVAGWLRGDGGVAALARLEERAPLDRALRTTPMASLPSFPSRRRFPIRPPRSCRTACSVAPTVTSG